MISTFFQEHTSIIAEAYKDLKRTVEQPANGYDYYYIGEDDDEETLQES